MERESSNRPRGLTQRQLRLIELVTRGLPNKKIASELGVSEQGVKEQISALLLRLSVPNRAALAVVGTRAAIVGAAVPTAHWLPYLFRMAPLSIAYLRGPAHLVEAINEEGRRTAGGREPVGKPFRSAFPQTSEEILKLLDDAYAEGRTRMLVAVPNRWDRRGTGAEEGGFLTVVAHPVPASDGGVGGLLLYAIDVSDAERSRPSSEQRAAERSQSLT